MEQDEVWNAIAPKWSKMRTETSEEVLNFLKGKQGKILDVGCGSGRNFVELDGAEIFGVDFSEKMISLAKKRGIAKELFCAKSDELPFEDETIDYCLCYALLHCVETEEDRRETIEEIYRVLKVGGEAFISVWGKNSPRLKSRDKEGLVPWTVNGEKFYRYTYVFDLKELEGLVKSVGFEIVNSGEDKNAWVVVKK